MKTLVLKCSSPMQSWSNDSRFNIRSAGRYPSRSGIIGIIASALGMDRNEPLDIFDGISTSIRIDKKGIVYPDYQVVHRWNRKNGNITAKGNAIANDNRYYIEDGIFMVFIEGDDGIIDKFADAIQYPVYSLFLGRKSCPPTYDFFYGVFDKDASSCIMDVPPEGEDHRVVVIRDVRDGELADDTVKDNPIAFNIKDRKYSGRQIKEYHVVLPSEEQKTVYDDDIMSLVEKREKEHE